MLPAMHYYWMVQAKSKLSHILPSKKKKMKKAVRSQAMRYRSRHPDFHLSLVHLPEKWIVAIWCPVAYWNITHLISILYWLSAGSGLIEIYIAGMVNCQADQMGLMVLDMSAVLSVTSPSEAQTGQRGGSLTMLIKHQDGGIQPRVKLIRDWEDSSTCTHGWPEHTASLEYVLHHSVERHREKEGKTSSFYAIPTFFKKRTEITVVWYCLLFSLSWTILPCQVKTNEANASVQIGGHKLHHMTDEDLPRKTLTTILL